MTFDMETGPAHAILFVRSKGDLPLALQQVNGYLAFRRNRSHARDDDKILAVCFRQDLDSGLPPLHLSTQEPGSPDLSLSISESFSLAGIWAVSWIDGLALSHASGRSQQRKVIFRAFLHLFSEPGSPGSFYPVFAWDESPEAAAMEMRRLKERYSHIADFIRFRQDGSRGVYSEPAVGQENCRSAQETPWKVGLTPGFEVGPSIRD